MSSITTHLNVDSSGAYSANPASVTVVERDTTLIYALDKFSKAEWKVTGLSTSDIKGQTGPYTISPDESSVSFVDYNTQSDSFNVTIFIAHRTTQVKARIDPAVTNEPPG